MNVAYKWYSHNNNIVQFYSDHSFSRKAYDEADEYEDDFIESIYSKTVVLSIPDDIKLLP